MMPYQTTSIHSNSDKGSFLFNHHQEFTKTIDKSQGQTLQQVGIFLEKPVFTHGQLSVAMSRVGSWNHGTTCS